MVGIALINIINICDTNYPEIRANYVIIDFEQPEFLGLELSRPVALMTRLTLIFSASREQECVLNPFYVNYHCELQFPACAWSRKAFKIDISSPSFYSLTGLHTYIKPRNLHHKYTLALYKSINLIKHHPYGFSRYQSRAEEP